MFQLVKFKHMVSYCDNIQTTYTNLFLQKAKICILFYHVLERRKALWKIYFSFVVL